MILPNLPILLNNQVEMSYQTHVSILMFDTFAEKGVAIQEYHFISMNLMNLIDLIRLEYQISSLRESSTATTFGFERHTAP